MTTIVLQLWNTPCSFSIVLILGFPLFCICGTPLVPVLLFSIIRTPIVPHLWKYPLFFLHCSFKIEQGTSFPLTTRVASKYHCSTNKELVSLCSSPLFLGIKGKQQVSPALFLGQSYYYPKFSLCVNLQATSSLKSFLHPEWCNSSQGPIWSSSDTPRVV